MTAEVQVKRWAECVQLLVFSPGTPVKVFLLFIFIFIIVDVLSDEFTKTGKIGEETTATEVSRIRQKMDNW